jgi:hypothetical protein
MYWMYVYNVDFHLLWLPRGSFYFVHYFVFHLPVINEIHFLILFR